MNDGQLKRVADKKAVDMVFDKQATFINKEAYKAVNGKGAAKTKATEGSRSSNKKNIKKSKSLDVKWFLLAWQSGYAPDF